MIAAFIELYERNICMSADDDNDDGDIDMCPMTDANCCVMNLDHLHAFYCRSCNERLLN